MTQVLISYASNIRSINLGNWGKTRDVLSPLVFQAIFFFFPSFSVRDFSTLRTIKRCYFLSPKLMFFNLGVFNRAALVFSGNEIGQPGTLSIMLVCFTSSGMRTEYCFGLDIDYFLYCILEAIQFAVVLLYFSPDKRFQTLSKAFNYSRFFQSPISVKFS